MNDYSFDPTITAATAATTVARCACTHGTGVTSAALAASLNELRIKLRTKCQLGLSTGDAVRSVVDLLMQLRSTAFAIRNQALDAVTTANTTLTAWWARWFPWLARNVQTRAEINNLYARGANDVITYTSALLNLFEAHPVPTGFLSKSTLAALDADIEALINIL